MDGAETPQGAPSNAGNDGEDEYNCLFWQALKAHYIDHPDDDLLLAIVENEQFNEHLKQKQR